MNFIKQKGFHLLIIFTSSEGSRITGNSTNVRWGFKEKWNGQQLSCTLWLQALNSHEIESDAATKSQQWLPNAIWLVDPRVCVCVCVCVCVFLLYLSAKSSTQTARVTGQTSSPTNKLHAVHQSLFALQELTSSWKPPWNEPFFLFFRWGNWNGRNQHTRGYRSTLWDKWN